MEKLRIGTLGAALITPQSLIKPAKSNPDVEVVAVAARGRARADAFAQKHGIPKVVGSYDDLLSDPDIDAIYNPLPNSHHKMWTIRALEAGKHVLCEKPFTGNADDAAEVKKVADAHPDQVVMEAFHWRYHPLAQRVIDLVRDGAVGEVRNVSTIMCIPLIKPGDIRWQLDLAGGALMDVGCYTIHILRHFSGEEPEVTSAQAWQLHPGVDRRVDATFRFPSGATGSICASMLSWKLIWTQATITGSTGEIRVINPTVPQIFHHLRITRSGQKSTEKVGGKGITTYGEQLKAFVAAVRTGAPTLTPPSESILNMRVIDDVYRKAGMQPRQSA